MARGFNGSTDQIVTASYNLTTAGTLFCWMYPISYGGGYVSPISHDAPGTVFQILLKSTGKLAYYPQGIDPGTATLTLNAWSAVGYSQSAAAGATAFVNGVSDGSGAASGLSTGSAPMGFGFDPNSGGRNFNGWIADAAEWSVVLTAAEHQALAKGARPKDIRPTSLLGYWPLNGFASPEPDYSGNARNGTLTGTTNVSGPPLMIFTPRWVQRETPSIVGITNLPGQFTTSFTQRITAVGY